MIEDALDSATGALNTSNPLICEPQHIKIKKKLNLALCWEDNFSKQVFGVTQNTVQYNSPPDLQNYLLYSSTWKSPFMLGTVQADRKTDLQLSYTSLQH